uniref:Uncharacterized protein n=1 Tax=Romanomermis culicivorax TaxID=13658 RepID=A0A915HYD0_ROMCU
MGSSKEKTHPKVNIQRRSTFERKYLEYRLVLDSEHRNADMQHTVEMFTNHTTRENNTYVVDDLLFCMFAYKNRKFYQGPPKKTIFKQTMQQAGEKGRGQGGRQIKVPKLPPPAKNNSRWPKNHLRPARGRKRSLLLLLTKVKLILEGKNNRIAAPIAVDALTKDIG